MADATLLEREPLLAVLRDAHARGGGMLFVAGEAGIGKSALVRAFCAGLPPGTPVHHGFCDALGTPRALGPLHDIARTSLAGLGRMLAAGADRHTVFTAFLDLLAAGPSVTVVEDAHWADEATLDLLLHLGRRVAALPATVVVTYRGEEVGRDHRLRRVLGDLATAPSVRRLTVPALSRAAVAELAGSSDRDAGELHAVTGGNPFFVTEALAAPAQRVPASVRDAVMARAGRLDADARAVLDVVSLVPDRAEVALLDGVAAARPHAAVDACVQAGMLVLDGPTVRFRHELARRAVESEVPAVRRTELHAHLLARLAATDGEPGTVDPARLSHHADAAGDSAAVLRYAPVAGRVAARLGAHREAAAHYARALQHAAGAPTEVRAHLWERRADECDRGGELADGLEASARAVELWRAAGDVEREASATARRTNMLWNSGRGVEAHASARAAVALIEPRPPGPVRAQAYAALAQMHMLANDRAGAIEWGRAAITHARRHGDDRVLAWALNAVGTAHWLDDPDSAVALLTDGLAAARRAGDDLAVAGVMYNLGSGAGVIRRYDLAERWLAEVVAWCTERDLDPLRVFGRSWQARCHFEQGRWAEATAIATEVVGDHPQHVPAQIVALTVLGRVRTRRGDPDADGPLERAWALAEQTAELQRLWPVAAARAEAAWLSGGPQLVEGLVAGTFALAVRVGHGWAAAELGHWLRVAGVDLGPVACAAGPYALEIAGDADGAARRWRELGCPYEAATALAGGGDADGQRAALDELLRLGARPAADLLARRLHAGGVRSLPRGPRRATRENPAQLTDRQVEVLDLIAGGLRNAGIAARLHISEKTVDHHVSAVLAKLGVGSRQEAARWVTARRGA